LVNGQVSHLVLFAKQVNGDLNYWSTRFIGACCVHIAGQTSWWVERAKTGKFVKFDEKIR
jgi:hypothetical protein